MSSRVLRKGRARAAAKVVNYDEGGNDSDDDEPIMPPRKRATRSSTGRSIASMARDDTPADEPEPSSRPTPDADAEMQPTGAENSASGSVSGTPSETPSDVGPFKPAPRKVRLRLSKANKIPSPAKPILDEDEDEDELVDENDEEGEEEVDESGGSESESDDDLGPSSTSMGGARPGMPMTARQAALAGLSTSSTPLISLDQIEASRRKGPEKTEEELAAKRREAAKRRKQQLVEKTQAEKEGAVDRLLNKQAPRPRGRRNQSALNTAAPGTPAGYATPVRGSGGGDTRSTSPDGDENGEEEEEYIPPLPEPTMMRWVSTSRGCVSTGDSGTVATVVAAKDADVEMTGPSEEAGKNPSPEEKQAQVAAEGSVPVTSGAARPAHAVAQLAPEKKELAFSLSIPATILEQLTASLPPSPPAVRPGPTGCGIKGCQAAKKYRVIVPGGEEKGACGLEHFKILKGSVGTA
ncbi:hypothetical protein M407DRAFT_121319 [Tulasnella calospora MUT 4182]|uniref:INO80 complex subunit B-like conserved region domain-containing protein n=1 Tax=Tulasnella calospora MUT 4182 TaxID=1051891 RepID=A0A0C3MDM3_9AGAM|nr:hypothetical protein M407DRAFT_121319 [Tulasnella calospora MUT 4182]